MFGPRSHHLGEQVCTAKTNPWKFNDHSRVFPVTHKFQNARSYKEFATQQHNSKIYRTWRLSSDSYWLQITSNMQRICGKHTRKLPNCRSPSPCIVTFWQIVASNFTQKSVSLQSRHKNLRPLCTANQETCNVQLFVHSQPYNFTLTTPQMRVS